MTVWLTHSASADPRRVADLQNNTWLRAIARLTVPTDRIIDKRRSAQIEHCSAVLIQPVRSTAQRALLLTAWHCIEHYHNLARPIEAHFQISTEQVLKLEARIIDRGRDMESDWALLQLTQRAPEVETLGLPLAGRQPVTGSSVIMAGYSRDDGVGRLGTVLSYDADCQITGAVGRQIESDCRAHRGASGGAVVQLDNDGRALLVGIISQGDGEQRSYHTPLEELSDVLRNRL